MLDLITVYQYLATFLGVIVWSIVLAGIYVAARLLYAARDTKFATDEVDNDKV